MAGAITLEICVDSVASAVKAQEGGAHRVELCASLDIGGITPSPGMVEIVRRHISIGLHVMIRPRGGDFCYSEPELEVMARDIASAKRNGANGVVFGVLDPNIKVDVPRNKILLDCARPLSVTFHRAFDNVPDPLEALEVLIRMGFDRVLTSGQGRSALEGLPLITLLVQKARGRISVMPGAGIQESNIKTILGQSGAKEIHVSRGVKTSASENPAPGTVDPAKVLRLLELTESS